MKISVAICTRDRASMLQRALQSLVACRAAHAAGDWEVLVVDNASSDATPTIVAQFRDLLPIRYARESQPGLSNARNRAVHEAHGEWIAWLDDDVTVDAGWLRAYADAIARHPDATAFGGPIAVHLEGNPPRWLSSGLARVEDAYAGRSAEQFRGQFFVRGEKPYGANFALRRAAALSTPFDPRLGRHPLRPFMGGEETEVIRAILTKGTGWWVPEAHVRHHIDTNRQSAWYLTRYYLCSGRSDARGWKALPRQQRWGDFLRAVRRAAIALAGYGVVHLLRIDHRRAGLLRDAAWYAGYVEGCIGALAPVKRESATA